MTDQMTPAERLRAAATRLREVAEVAPPGPWRYAERATGHPADGPTEVWVMSPVNEEPMLTGGYDSFSGYAAALAAMMSPPVALALADWLDHEAYLADWEYETPPAALAVADAVLGGEQ